MKDILRRPTWYRMTQVFDGLAKKIADVGEHGVILRGVRYEAAIKCGECGHTIHLHNLRVGASGDKLDLSPEIGICVVPMGIPDSMGERGAFHGLRRVEKELHRETWPLLRRARVNREKADRLRARLAKIESET